jgi:hypothetical protein
MGRNFDVGSQIWGANMKIVGLEEKLELLINTEADEPITPEIIQAEAEVDQMLEYIHEALRPIRNRIHRVLNPEEYTDIAEAE